MINYRECAECKAKPGSPILCGACLHNRRIAGLAEALRQALIETTEALEMARMELGACYYVRRYPDPTEIVDATTAVERAYETIKASHEHE